ncbi:hypothetical protein GS784_25120 [Rhodococcus hoagii]|nr:hypothetical protein [Prescottella equi]
MTTPEPSHENTENATVDPADHRTDEDADPEPARGARPRFQHSRGGVGRECGARINAAAATPTTPAGRARRRRRMQVIRQTRTIEKPVPVPAVEYRVPPPTATPARHSTTTMSRPTSYANPDLLAKILDMFSAGLRSLPPGRELAPVPCTSPSSASPLRLDDYRRHTPPPPPKSVSSGADSRRAVAAATRRALDRRQAKKPRH